MKKKPLENVEFAEAIGKSTLLRIDWLDWKKEQPKNGEDVWVVVKLENGYYPVRGTYFDETFFKSRWRSVKFFDAGIPDIFLKSEDDNRLIAWGRNQTVVQIGIQCVICGELQCQC